MYFVHYFGKYCANYELAHSAHRLIHLNLLVIGCGGVGPVTYRIVETEMAGLYKSLEVELDDKKILFMAADKAAYFEQDRLFGQGVYVAFPMAQADIKEAGNCLAADLNTAAIFHLMRVVEIGLRWLAKHLVIKMSKSELAYSEWNGIIEQIEAKIKQEKSKPRGKKKSDALEFYHGVMGEFNAFKDVWRNNVMHSRRSYNEPEAIGVFLRVKSFMQRLSKRATERSTK